MVWKVEQATDGGYTVSVMSAAKGARDVEEMF